LQNGQHKTLTYKYPSEYKMINISQQNKTCLVSVTSIGWIKAQAVADKAG